MKVSGFTIVQNAIKYGYPVVESINSILPICDEFIVNVGDSEDGTLELIRSIDDKKIKIIENKWDLNIGESVLSQQTNIALSQCKGDWAFYLQADEVVHEKDLPRLKRYIQKYLNRREIRGLRFEYLHFYGSYYRYRIGPGWFQKENRIIRNNGNIISVEDAKGFMTRDGQHLRWVKTGACIYHYGWVHPPEIMTRRRVMANEFGFTAIPLTEEELSSGYDYGELEDFPIFTGSHPAVMRDRINRHELSKKDLERIRANYLKRIISKIKILIMAKWFRRYKNTTR